MAAATASSGGSKGAISACASGTLSMAPGGSAPTSRPRAATRAIASGSEKTPARQAAASSPMLWPSSACGTTPHDIQRRARATSTAKSAGWVSSVRSRRRPAAAASSGGGHSSRRRSSPQCGRSSSAQWSITSRKTASSA